MHANAQVICNVQNVQQKGHFLQHLYIYSIIKLYINDDDIDLQYSVPSLKAMMVFLCLPRHHKLCSIKGEMATALTELCGQCGSGLGSQHFGGNI